jgi:DNA-binding NarL/FixJ family response regulator
MWSWIPQCSTTFPSAKRETCSPETLFHEMAEGRSNRAIGDRLGLTERTVEANVRVIMSKLGLEPDPDQHRRVLAVLTYLREA